MKYVSIFVVCLLALSVAGCGGGGSGSTTGSNGVSGSGSKGPFQTGSTVTAYKLDANGARTTTTATTTVSDNLGTYSLSGISWSGATEIVITGKYLNESTGTVTTNDDTLSAFVVLPAIGTVVSSETVNPNIASDASAKLAKDNMSASGGTLDAAAAISSASDTVLQAFGIKTTDASGNAIDPNKLDLTKTGDAALGAANAQLLVMSAALKSTAGTGSVDVVKNLIANLVADIKNGSALGTTGGKTAAINTAIITANTNAATLANNLTTAIQLVDSTRAALTTVQITNAAAAVTTNVTTAVKGFALGAGTVGGVALLKNQFSIGTGTTGANTKKVYTIADNGGLAATTATSLIAKTDVVLKAKFKDYSNVTGTGNGTATTYNTTFSYYIKAQVGSRKIEGSLSPVKVTTDGAGNVSITVPASAVLTFSGTDSQGAVITGTATNVGSNLIQASASALSIDANALLTSIQNKVGNTSLNVLTTNGTFDFEFGLGLNIGFDTGSAMSGLYKTGTAGAKVSGRRIHGVITTI